jgi:hypothetical protein
VKNRGPALWLAFAVIACGDADHHAVGAVTTSGSASDAKVAGALLAVRFESRVGVLLDEIPSSIRARVADDMLAKDEAFWTARAKRQLALASYRLNFRGGFYEEEDAKKQLPLPPEGLFEIELGSAMRVKVGDHDYVLVDYTLQTTVLTDIASPTISEPALSAPGSSWDEPFVFPIDPELLLQRTGYACMDEAEFPPNSVDSEDVEFFYDQTCDVELELTKDGCHYTELAGESCVDALDAHVGKVEAPMHYEWLPWNSEQSEQVRLGDNETGADLQVLNDELAVNRLTYRYISEDSCAIAEQCVGGSGFRRLLQFNASEKNVGAKPLVIGNVDYFLDNPDTLTANANHHIYEYSACHMHYHFSHYATFSYAGQTDLGSKRAFCLESVARYSNNENSPTWSDFGSCHNQGISEGWGDQYNAGIECQWVDVTSFDTRAGAIDQALGLVSNPDGFLCEGSLVLQSSGDIRWEETEFKTDQGETVERPMCDFMDGWQDNNGTTLDVTLPLPGEGMVTSKCTRGQIGKLRNCGFDYDDKVRACKPGEMFTLSCSVPVGSAPQVVRVCEASKLLDTGLACVHADELGSVEIGPDPVSLSFRCPRARDAAEPGGRFALYTGPSYPADPSAAIDCTAD